jgi:hypothetical protein
MKKSPWSFRTTAPLTVAGMAAAIIATALPANATTDQDIIDQMTWAVTNAGVEAPVANPGVTLPDAGTDAAALALDTGVLEVTPDSAQGAPFESTSAKRSFDTNNMEVAVGVQSTSSGLRSLIYIESGGAPRRYDFSIGGDVASLELTEDGGVAALDANGDLVAAAPEPWAVDSAGDPVETHYEVSGTTFTQVVSHGGRMAYPIVADPWWNPFSWPWGKWVTKSKKVVSSALKKCGQGALVTTLGLGVTTGTTNVMIEKFGSGIAKVKVGGAYGCIVNTL